MPENDEHFEQNLKDTVFMTTFIETLQQLIAGINDLNAKFATLNTFLSVMREEPVPEVLLQSWCETMVEKEILSVMIQSHQVKKHGEIHINLN